MFFRISAPSDSYLFLSLASYPELSLYSDGDAPAQQGGDDVLLAFPQTLCCVFLFQVVRAYSGVLDEGVNTTQIPPRHGRRSRPTEVVEMDHSLSLLVLLDGVFIKHSLVFDEMHRALGK